MQAHAKPQAETSNDLIIRLVAVRRTRHYVLRMLISRPTMNNYATDCLGMGCFRIRLFQNLFLVFTF